MWVNFNHPYLLNKRDSGDGLAPKWCTFYILSDDIILLVTSQKGRTWWHCWYGWRGVSRNGSFEMSFVSGVEYVRQHLSLVWRCSFVAPDTFQTSVSCSLHNELLINTCLVKPSGICCAKWMVRLVARNPCMLTHSADGFIQFAVANTFCCVPALWPGI